MLRFISEATTAALCGAVCGTILAALALTPLPIPTVPTTPPPLAPFVHVLFSPRGDCTNHIVRQIDAAEHQVLMQSYSFTSAPIADALIRAHARGVEVGVCIDSLAAMGHGSQAKRLVAASVPVWLDSKHAIAHSKTIAIDGVIVLTGSFNWTTAAEERNLENLVTIRSTEMASAYIANWHAHQSHCTRLQAAAPTGCNCCPACKCPTPCPCKPGSRCTSGCKCPK